MFLSGSVTRLAANNFILPALDLVDLCVLGGLKVLELVFVTCLAGFAADIIIAAGRGSRGWRVLNIVCYRIAKHGGILCRQCPADEQAQKNER